MQLVKNLPAKAEDVRDMDSIPGSGRSPGVGSGTSLQYSCLEYFMDREIWWAAVHWVLENQTRLSRNTYSGWKGEGWEHLHRRAAFVQWGRTAPWSVSPRHALVQHLLALKVPRNHLGLFLKCSLSFSSAGVGSEIHISYKTRRCWCWGLWLPLDQWGA